MDFGAGRTLEYGVDDLSNVDLAYATTIHKAMGSEMCIRDRRIMGKASFCNVQDLKGSIQSYVARDCIGEESSKSISYSNSSDWRS